MATEPLQQGLAAMGLTLSPEQQSKLQQYLALLIKWNKAFNLSAVREPGVMISRHLLDSLSLVPFIQDRTPTARQILDVGTGPGLPGIPLAICFQDINFVLLDSNGKKTRFVFQAAFTLGLENVQTENCRVEHYQSPAQIDIVVCRAFTSLADLAEKTRHLQQNPEQPLTWLAMKGLYPDTELAALPADIRVNEARKISIPGEPAERHIIDMQTAGPESRQ